MFQRYFFGLALLDSNCCLTIDVSFIVISDIVKRYTVIYTEIKTFQTKLRNTFCVCYRSSIGEHLGCQTMYIFCSLVKLVNGFSADCCSQGCCDFYMNSRLFFCCTTGHQNCTCRNYHCEQNSTKLFHCLDINCFVALQQPWAKRLVIYKQKREAAMPHTQRL